MMETQLRFADRKDIPEIRALILELAIYEKAEHEVKTTAKDFEDHWDTFNVLLAENSNEIVGMAFFHNEFSTWIGEYCYLDDLIVKHNYRRQGIGKLLFERLIDYVNENKMARLKWEVLDWNELAIDFYKKYDTQFDSEWIACRLKKEQLDKLKK